MGAICTLAPPGEAHGWGCLACFSVCSVKTPRCSDTHIQFLQVLGYSLNTFRGYWPIRTLAPAGSVGRLAAAVMKARPPGYFPESGISPVLCGGVLSPWPQECDWPRQLCSWGREMGCWWTGEPNHFAPIATGVSKGLSPLQTGILEAVSEAGPWCSCWPSPRRGGCAVPVGKAEDTHRKGLPLQAPGLENLV